MELGKKGLIGFGATYLRHLKTADK